MLSVHMTEGMFLPQGDSRSCPESMQFTVSSSAPKPIKDIENVTQKSVKFSPADVVRWTHGGGRPSAAIMLQEMTLFGDGQLQLERKLRLNQLTGDNWLMQHTVRPAHLY